MSIAYAPPGYNKKSKNITCKQCTAKQTASLQCMTCTKTKPLEQFAKVKQTPSLTFYCIHICLFKCEGWKEAKVTIIII